MVDPTHRPNARAAGFTLVEMLAALGILLFGVTALIGALSSSVAQRRTTDARLETTALCEVALHRLQYEAVRRTADAATDLDLELVPLENQTSPDFPGMTWSATPIVDASRPDVWLIRLEIQWLEEGEQTGEVFFRVLPRQLPLGARVLRFREQVPATSER
jgi:type II secretory pathway pseudopilin PulG